MYSYKIVGLFLHLSKVERPNLFYNDDSWWCCRQWFILMGNLTLRNLAIYHYTDVLSIDIAKSKQVVVDDYFQSGSLF